MKKFTNNVKLVIILLMVMISAQSCAKDGLNPRVTTQTIKYVVFNEKPTKENLSGTKGAYMDQDGDGLADVRYGDQPRPFTANKDDYMIDKVLRKPEIVIWDGNLNHPYQKTGETVCVAFGYGTSNIVVGKPIPVSVGNVLFTISKDSYDRVQQNTSGWSTYVEANL